jgi:diguanylate cyclase (GGDEF)-like protein/PAS domain S-box-containing protein
VNSASQATNEPGNALLLIDGKGTGAERVLKALTSQGRTRVEWAKSLAEGLDRLQRPGIVAILLDLSLPDSAGIETLDKVRVAAQHVPILVLCSNHDETIRRRVAERGADEFLLRGHLDGYSLMRAVGNILNAGKTESGATVETDRAGETLAAIADAVLSTDISGHVTYLNAAAEHMTGWLLAEAAGRPSAEVFRIIDGAIRTPSDNPLARAVRENRTLSLSPDSVLIRRDGSELPVEDSTAPIHDRDGRTTGAVIVFHDVSAARQAAAQLSHMAEHDFLTDLPNRMLLDDRLRQAIALAQRHGSRIAVLFLDLDRFKHINDSLGHVIGDQLLQSVALRLKRSVRRSDTVGRLGGDEFLVILSEVNAVEDAAVSAAKLLAVLTVPYHIALHDIHVPVSIGVSIYPDDGEDTDALINNADTAMYHAKEKGRNNYQFFKQEMIVRAVERQFIEGSLGLALERGEFSLRYQPKIDLSTRAIVGVEALLRWRHPERGFIPPAQFVPIAEDTGLILPIGQWVLREACRQSHEWLRSGLPQMPMAVNISAVEFRSQNFVEDVNETLTTAGLPASCLELELTESVLMQHAESTVSMLKSLKTLGVQIAVDDFGTGYSSLSYLRQFPVDSLKVDQSFVHAISLKSEDAVIVSAVISMGNSLGKRVIAEGVETRDQLNFLTAAGCEEAQGYYFSRPLLPEKFAALLQPGSGSDAAAPTSH